MTRGMDISGFANFDASKKGDNGKSLCRVCGKEVSGRRQTFCSDACVDTFLIQTDTEYARKKVFERDRGVCKLCGLDTEAVLAEKTASHMADGVTAGHARKLAVQAVLIVWGYPQLKRRMLWDMDHAQPVVLGGTNDMANLRTLCIPCHKLQTKNLMKQLRGSPLLKRMRKHPGSR